MTQVLCGLQLWNRHEFYPFDPPILTQLWRRTLKIQNSHTHTSPPHTTLLIFSPTVFHNSGQPHCDGLFNIHELWISRETNWLLDKWKTSIIHLLTHICTYIYTHRLQHMEPFYMSTLFGCINTVWHNTHVHTHRPNHTHTHTQGEIGTVLSRRSLIVSDI